jgi:monoamine oxidase
MSALRQLQPANALQSVDSWEIVGSRSGMPQGSIHFAGEHCSQDFQGYMEGGASEGVRAGQEVLAEL